MHLHLLFPCSSFLPRAKPCIPTVDPIPSYALEVDSFSMWLIVPFKGLSLGSKCISIAFVSSPFPGNLHEDVAELVVSPVRLLPGSHSHPSEVALVMVTNNQK